MSYNQSSSNAPSSGDTGGRGGSGKAGFRRRKTCPFSGDNAPAIDWKDVKMLSKFISEKGKIMPSRITNVCQKKQRELAQAIKRARFMALMPFTREEVPAPFIPRGDRPERFDRSSNFGGDRPMGDRPSRGPRDSGSRGE